MKYFAPLAVAVGVLCFIASVTSQVAAETQSTDTQPEFTLTIGTATILGLIEGATEYLPVSSTGHLLLYQQYIGMSEEAGSDCAAHALAICIQSGAILAVLVLYHRRIRDMIAGLIGRSQAGRQLALNLVSAFFPAAVIGVIAHSWIKAHLFGVIPVAAALFVGGVLIIVLDRFKCFATSEEAGKSLEELKWHQALVIGLVQCVSFWPGFSRSFAAILGGQVVGMRLRDSVEFSFLLGLVTLSAATLFEGFDKGAIIINQYGLLSPIVALLAAFVSAMLGVKFLVASLQRFGLLPFGYYRIALALCCVLWLW